MRVMIFLAIRVSDVTDAAAALPQPAKRAAVMGDNCRRPVGLGASLHRSACHRIGFVPLSAAVLVATIAISLPR